MFRELENERAQEYVRRWADATVRMPQEAAASAVAEKTTTPQTPPGPGGNYTPINRRQFILGAAGVVGSLVLPGCKKSAPSSQSAVSPSITSESQEAKESRIKAQIQALLQNSGENVDDDPMLNLAGSITHMLVDEAKFERLETLAVEGRLSFVRVAEKDMSTLYGLAQELNTVMEGFAYVNAFTFIAEDEDGLPVYTVIINEREFQKPPVELWVTLIHEVFGRVLNVEMSGRLGNLAAEEARAYETEAQVLDRVISNQDAVGQAVQQAWLSREDYELLLHTLNIPTLKDKRNEAKQQAEYYQKQADADSITTGPGLDYNPINRRQFVLGVLGAAGSLVLPGCKKETPSEPATSQSITSESQADREEGIKAEMQALLQKVGEGASYDPQLNFTGAITHMLVEEAEFIRLEKLAGEGRIRFVKVAESDMPRFYKLAQELNAVIKGRNYLNAFTFTNEEDGLSVYTIIINEREFQKPPVDLWITFIHEGFGRVSETEMFGKLASMEAGEARAYRKEVKILDRVILHNDMFIQYLQGPTPSEEHSQLVRQVLDIETLMEKKDKAKQQAEYYQRKADAEPGKQDFLFKEALDEKAKGNL